MGFDRQEALERVGGDEELLKEIAELFVEDAPELIEKLRGAVAAGDAAGVETAAHSLKGSVANFGAEEAVAAALRLEQMGREGQLDGAPDAMENLEAEIAVVKDELEKLT